MNDTRSTARSAPIVTTPNYIELSHTSLGSDANSGAGSADFVLRESSGAPTALDTSVSLEALLRALHLDHPGVTSFAEVNNSVLLTLNPTASNIILAVEGGGDPDEPASGPALHGICSDFSRRDLGWRLLESDVGLALLSHPDRERCQQNGDWFRSVYPSFLRCLENRVRPTGRSRAVGGWPDSPDDWADAPIATRKIAFAAQDVNASVGGIQPNAFGPNALVQKLTIYAMCEGFGGSNRSKQLDVGLVPERHGLHVSRRVDVTKGLLRATHLERGFGTMHN